MAEGTSTRIAAPYVEVALPVPLRKLFTYNVPGNLHGDLEPGSRVAVSFNRRKLAGFVVGGRAELPEGVARAVPVAGLLERQPVFTAELMRFLESAAKYYMHPFGEVLRAAAPALPTGAMRRLREDGFLEPEEHLPGRRVARHTTWRVRRTAATEPPTRRLGSRQQEVLQALGREGTLLLAELRAICPDARSVVRSLQKKGLVRVDEIEVDRDPFFAKPVLPDEPPRLTESQEVAVAAIEEAIRGRATKPFLLHGITGSGKTEVYLRAIAIARSLGRGALLLVPEIALTPQLVSRFRARFGDEISVLHSGLSPRQRDDAWQALRKGRVQMAIGARSALFSPVHDLGLVVVDEEHDPSFKQEEGFRYHARDMALLRAQYASAVCVLGSATPSIESYHRASQGDLRMLSLPTRATGQRLPEVEIVDLKRHRQGPSQQALISAPLHSAISGCLESGHQAILFLNRRGFSPSVRCVSCGAIAECPACSVALTEHRAEASLRCHYCDFHRPSSAPCGGCGGRRYDRLGIGTEQLQDAVGRTFPTARVDRLDRDTASGQGVEQVLGRLRRGDIDILIGTQMVAKGHDIARVTLVGVILADQSLAFPDFRATERTFQLLAQVAGRAGRANEPGRVILQTYQPNHSAIRFAADHDYQSFFRTEIDCRRDVRYPPFARLAAVRVSAGSSDDAHALADALAVVARRHPRTVDRSVQVLGPAPAPLARLRARYRYRILLKSPDRKALRAVAAELATHLDHPSSRGRATLDIDPVAML